QVLEEQTTGDIYDKHHQFNYYTAGMYAGLFFAVDTICGETNIVGSASFSTEGKSGLAKHKEQLKMLFFNPGKKIPGIPFIGSKVDIFDPDISKYYDFSIDMEEMKDQQCYVFKIQSKPGEAKHVVFDNITTWFNAKTM